MIWFDAVTVQFSSMAPSNYTWAEAFTTIDLSSSTSEVITQDNLRCFIVVAAIGDAPGVTNQNRASLMMFPGETYTFTWQSFKGTSGFYIKTMGYRIYWEDNRWKGAATYTGIDFNASYNSNDIKIWNVSPQKGYFWIVGAILKA